MFFEPQKESVYKTAERKLIYVHQVDNSSGKLPLYDGSEKVGEASTPDFPFVAQRTRDYLNSGRCIYL